MSLNNDNNKKAGNRQAAAVVPVFRWARIVSGRSALIAILLSTVLFSGLSVVYSTYKNRYVFHELQQLRNENNELQVQWGQLLIEQSTFGLEGRIERKAMDELGMKLPDWSRIILVKYD